MAWHCYLALTYYWLDDTSRGESSAAVGPGSQSPDDVYGWTKSRLASGWGFQAGLKQEVGHETTS